MVFLSKFAHDTKWNGIVDTLERRDAIQWNLARLKEWAHVNLRKFKETKHKVLHRVSANTNIDTGWVTK